MKALLLGALVLALALLVDAPRAAAVLATSTVASPIAPGDIIFTEFFEGWHKLNPTTGVVTALPWPEASVFTENIQFDVDGAILYDDSGGAVKRLNPTTGSVVDLGVPNVRLTDGFVVEDNGDLLIANSGDVSRFSRAAQTATIITSGDFFSPNGIASGGDGRVFITEFFDGLWEIDPATGGRSLVTTFDLSIPGLIEVRSDGDLIVDNFTPDVLFRVDPDTGAVSEFTNDLPTFVRDFVLDPDDNLWLSSTDGIFRYGSDGGPKILVASGTFFSPRAMAIVPAGWTAPVPEPGTAGLALAALACIAARRRGPRVVS